MANTVSDSQREACPTLPGAIPGLAFALASHQISESPGACGRNHEAETVRQSGLVISISDVPLPGIVTPATTSGANQSSPRHFARNTWTDGERLSGLPLGSLLRGKQPPTVQPGSTPGRRITGNLCGLPVVV